MVEAVIANLGRMAEMDALDESLAMTSRFRVYQLR